jgi:hypothetical protein
MASNFRRPEFKIAEGKTFLLAATSNSLKALALSARPIKHLDTHRHERQLQDLESKEKSSWRHLVWESTLFTPAISLAVSLFLIPSSYCAQQTGVHEMVMEAPLIAIYSTWVASWYL